MSSHESTSALRLRYTRFITEEIRQLYLRAFPPEERRPLHFLDYLLWLPTHPSSLIVAEIKVGGQWAPGGFITLWKIYDKLYYIEHFAVVASARGNGIGTAILKQLTSLLPDDSAIIIEVELPDNEVARKRIAFYERCGFVLHAGYDYIQPPYSKSQPEVKMMLMTRGSISNHSLDTAVARLKSIVYNK